ncbi:MAG: hypothetical protein QHC90_30300 [Shinella sp.]|nr:hypothetical protein [Shinella sp.]
MTSLQYRQRSFPSSARFTVGRDHHGWWVVQDRLRRIGGLFANEDAALHFAAGESDHNPAEVCRAPEGVCVELEPAARTRPARSGARRAGSRQHSRA